MKSKIVAVALLICCCLSATLAMAAGTNSADSIKGRLGVTGRLGFIVPADSEAVGAGIVIGKSHTDAGFIGGGGFIYGLTNTIATDFEITHSNFGSDGNTDFDTTNISLGGQYRFLDLPVKDLIPFAGAGVDILVNGANNGLDVDTVAGVHVKAGVDYFVMREVALTSEIKGILAPNADITRPGTGKVGNFDPDSFSMTFGVRYFFN